MLLLKTGTFVIAVFPLLAPLCSTNQGTNVPDPKCNNHGTLLHDGRCHCHNSWYGRKCEFIRNIAYSTQGRTPGNNHHPAAFHPQCNNHGFLSPDGSCHCDQRWHGRKCELLRNEPPNTQGRAPDNNHHPAAFHPQCNNHGFLSPDGSCHCGRRWHGRKCELLNKGVVGPLGQPFVDTGSRVPDPRCNNHGTMLAHRGCRCYGNWYGRKCELYKNSGSTSQMWLERDCVIFPGGICLCRHNQFQAKCEQVHQNHKVTSHTHRTTSSSKLAMTTNKPNPIVYLTTKHSAILAPSVTSSTTTAKFSAAASASTTPAAPLPSSFKVTTSTVPATSRAMTSKSTAASTKATPTTTIPTTAPVTSVFVPTISNSTRVSVQNVSTSIVTTTITLPPSSQSTSTKPAKIQNTPSVSSNGKTVLPPTKLPSVTSVLPSVSTNPPPKTLPPVSTVCAVCSGPAFLCEKLYAPTECHPPNNYCINTIVNHKDGSKSVNRTCGNFDTCYREWFLGSSDNDKCRKLSASDEQRLDFQCTFCCVEDNCNTPLHPSDRTLYKPTK